MKTIPDEMLSRILAYLPAAVIHLLRTHHCFLSGSFPMAAITGNKITDIDVFIHTDEVEKAVADMTRFFGYLEIARTTHAVTMHPKSGVVPHRPVQLISLTQEDAKNPEAYIKKFDFTNVQAAVSCDVGFYLSWMADEFLYDIAHGNARYVEDGRIPCVTSLWRLFKKLPGYQIKMTDITKASFVRLVELISEGTPMPADVIETIMKSYQEAESRPLPLDDSF